jgi:glucosamine--fructose-6-phosphate aminotransferase (isomerizing)
LRLEGSLVLALSQSGQSPDICEVLVSARRAGAVTVALVNQVNSPLAEAAEYVVPLWAGTETAVAATKSYIATLAALTQLLATYLQEPSLLNCVARLPDTLQAALEVDWSQFALAWKDRQDGLIIGRGFGYPIAQEAALKLKETSSLHAEAFSSAEVLHGPVALVKQNYPVLLLSQNDVTLPGTLSIAEKIAGMGAHTCLALPENIKADLPDRVVRLPLPTSIHPLADAMMSIQAFYRIAARLAVMRGYNPDQPENLQKVTQTR